MRKYKFEFARRNSRIKDLIEQLHQAGSSTPKEWAQKRFKVWNELIEKFHFHTAEINDFILAMGIKDHRAYSLIKTSSVNIVFQEKGKSYALPLDYNEINFKDPNSKGFYRSSVTFLLICKKSLAKSLSRLIELVRLTSIQLSKCIH